MDKYLKIIFFTLLLSIGCKAKKSASTKGTTHAPTLSTVQAESPLLPVDTNPSTIEAAAQSVQNAASNYLTQTAATATETSTSQNTDTSINTDSSTTTETSNTHTEENTTPSTPVSETATESNVSTSVRISQIIAENATNIVINPLGDITAFYKSPDLKTAAQELTNNTNTVTVTTTVTQTVTVTVTSSNHDIDIRTAASISGGIILLISGSVAAVGGYKLWKAGREPLEEPKWKFEMLLEKRAKKYRIRTPSIYAENGKLKTVDDFINETKSNFAEYVEKDLPDGDKTAASDFAKKNIAEPLREQYVKFLKDNNLTAGKSTKADYNAILNSPSAQLKRAAERISFNQKVKVGFTAIGALAGGAILATAQSGALGLAETPSSPEQTFMKLLGILEARIWQLRKDTGIDP